MWKKRTTHKIFHNIRNVLELQYLVDVLVDSLKLLMFIMLIFNILFDEVVREHRNEKKKFSYTTFKWYKYSTFS